MPPHRFGTGRFWRWAALVEARKASWPGTTRPPPPASKIASAYVIVFTSSSTKALAPFFPGASNQTGSKQAQLKIQAYYDLRNESFVDFSLSSFRKNDQAASKDILALAQPNDLILRDLGYFVRFLDVFSGTGTISFTEKTQPEYLFRTLLPQCVSIMARLP